MAGEARSEDEHTDDEFATDGDDDDSVLLGDEGAEIGDAESQNGSDSSSKKRRKRKKKKKAAGAGPPAVQQAAQAAGPSKQEADARFATTLQQLQRESPDCIWTRLSDCNIYDAKTRKVAEAIQGNRELTCLDLSGNHIGAAGVEALAEALQGGAAPELILLDLRGNAFDVPTARKALAVVQKQRRSLKIELEGPREPPMAAAASLVGVEGEAAPLQQAAQQQQQQQQQQGQGQANGFLNRFFQVGNGLGADTAGGSAEARDDPEAASQQLWEQVEAELGRQPVSIPALSGPLRECLAGLCKEMDTSATPLLASTRLPELRPFTRRATQSLPLLGRALDVQPRPHPAPHSPAQPLRGVGTAAAAAAQIVERLAFARAAAINTHLARSALLPRLFALCFAVPHNNVLQAACCGTIRWALESGLHLLWLPLFNANLGLRRGGKGPLPRRLLEVLQAAADAPSPAKRACNAGFALHVAAQLREAAADTPQLQESLQGCEGWAEAAAPGGLLDRLLGEQQGDLCGPRPRKGAEPDFQQEPTDVPNLIASDDLQRLLLQSFSGVHVSEEVGGGEDEDLSSSDEEADEAESPLSS